MKYLQKMVMERVSMFGRIFSLLFTLAFPSSDDANSTCSGVYRHYEMHYQFSVRKYKANNLIFKRILGTCHQRINDVKLKIDYLRGHI